MEITAKEMNAAEVMWIQYIQRKHYITHNGQLNKKQKQSELNPSIYPDGIIRLNGRLVNSDFPEETKSPILLPRTEHFSKLLITEIHEDICHSGVSHTLSQLRQKYCMPQGRTVIKMVLRKCLRFICYQRGSF